MSKAKINGKSFNLSDKKQCEAYWTAYAENALLGKTIKRVRYLSDKECETLGWYSKTLILELNDGTLIFSSQDDEGNGAGALFGSKGKEELTFPVI